MREPGFYWVRYSSTWEVAAFFVIDQRSGWFTTDEMTNGPCDDADFAEIDERRIERLPRGREPDGD